MLNLRVFDNGKLVQRGTPYLFATPEKHTKDRELDTTTPEKETELQTSKDVEAASSLDALVKSYGFLALSLPNCPQCDELAAMLSARGVPVSSVFVKWDKSSPEYPAQKAALAAHAGASFSFPQVFANGAYQGGFVDVTAKLEAGAYDAFFDELFGTVPSTVKSWVERQPMVIFSLPDCPQCEELKELLHRRGVPVDAVFKKLDKAWPQYQSLKAQLIQLIGRSQFTFPQTFVRSEYQGSFDEVSALVRAGSLDAFFADAFGITTVRPEPEPVAAVVSAAMSFDEDF